MHTPEHDQAATTPATNASYERPAGAASVASPSAVPISKPGAFRAETRTRQVLVRLTPTEYDELLATVAETGMTAPDLLRAGWRFLKTSDEQARATG